MSVFYKIKVARVDREVKDAVVLGLDIPDSLQGVFGFKQGQYITFRKTIDGADVRRSYSLCTSPLDKAWKVAVKQIPNGIFSTFVNTQLKEGDELEVSEPSGKFYVETNPKNQKHYIAFVAGSGITPVLSIIKTHLMTEPKSTFKLFYLNKTAQSIILKEEIEQLKNLFFDRFERFYLFSKEQRDIAFLNGRFDEKKLDFVTKNIVNIEDIDDCFLCGPRDMIFLIRDYLLGAGLSKDKIHYELFFSGEVAEDRHTIQITKNKFQGTEVTVIDGGKEFHFTMSDNYDTILDNALAAGADLPFACKGGVCSTCKCRVIKGAAAMKVNYALEDTEVAQNIVLSCQAVPMSKKVVVDFDI